MTKRILAALAACAVIMSAVGCGEPAENSSAAATTTSAATSDTTAAVASTAEQQETVEAAETSQSETVVTEQDGTVRLDNLKCSFDIEAPYTEYIILSMLMENKELRAFPWDTTVDAYLTINTVNDNIMRSFYSENPEINFVENWGCYPITLYRYANMRSGHYDMQDLTGCAADELYKCIDEGNPVAVWVTEDLTAPEVEMTSGEYQLLGPHECVMLVGYSDTSVTVWSALKKDYVTYDKALFNQRFEEMGSMALVAGSNKEGFKYAEEGLVGDFVPKTPYTEYDMVGMLAESVGDSALPFDAYDKVFGVGEDLEASKNPSLVLVEGWGAYPIALNMAYDTFGYCYDLDNLTDCEASTLYEYIDNGMPVAVWVTENLAAPEVVMTSGEYELLGPNECVMLVGYSDTSVKVYSLLQQNYVIYDKALFEQRFEEMGRMAMSAS